ncbi:hypothetical protein CLOM_g23085 [Closterium sp. NIES-68]|nr:hypothetical protein CLOM_g23085 [Closterium sp. NIES-68]
MLQIVALRGSLVTLPLLMAMHLFPMQRARSLRMQAPCPLLQLLRSAAAVGSAPVQRRHMAAQLGPTRTEDAVPRVVQLARGHLPR